MSQDTKDALTAYAAGLLAIAIVVFLVVQAVRA